MKVFIIEGLGRRAQALYFFLIFIIGVYYAKGSIDS